MNILFENSKFIAVNKEPGIIVIPDQHTSFEDTLVGRVSKVKNQKIWVVHRIDRDTSGVLLFAKDADSHSYICRQFEKGSVEKKYLSIVNGRFDQTSGIINKNILTHNRKVDIDPKGKEAITNYRIIEQFKDFTLLELTPKTGRRHQIRIHLWSEGHSLIVDPEYSHKKEFFLSEIKLNYKKSGAEKALISRLSLHAAKISLIDPETKNNISIEALMPRDFQVTLKQLRKYNK